MISMADEAKKLFEERIADLERRVEIVEKVFARIPILERQVADLHERITERDAVILDMAGAIKDLQDR